MFSGFTYFLPISEKIHCIMILFNIILCVFDGIKVWISFHVVLLDFHENRQKRVQWFFPFTSEIKSITGHQLALLMCLRKFSYLPSFTETIWMISLERFPTYFLNRRLRRTATAIRCPTATRATNSRTTRRPSWA